MHHRRAHHLRQVIVCLCRRLLDPLQSSGLWSKRSANSLFRSGRDRYTTAPESIRNLVGGRGGLTAVLRYFDVCLT